MSNHMTTYYMAEQLTGEQRAKHAARDWERRAALQPTESHRWKRALLVLAVAALSLGGVTVSLANDLPALSDGVITERTAAGSGETIPTHPFDGRPW